MKDLHSILKAVARGSLDVPKAEALIQELFESSLNQQRDPVDSVLTSLGEKIGLGSLAKKSRELRHKLDFKPHPDGIDSKLSLFSDVNFSDDTHVEGNVISGSHWREAQFSDVAEVRSNHFTLSQITDLKCQRSNISENEFGLTRILDMTVSESRFESNRVSRSQVLDFSLAESDFLHNRLLRSEFKGVVLNASRVAHCVLTSCLWSECEFDQSDFRGIRFDDCSFLECCFRNCEIVAEEPVNLSGLHVKGLVFEGLRSVEDLRGVLESQGQSSSQSADTHQPPRPKSSGPHKLRRSRH